MGCLMMIGQKIKVLIVDDSYMFRELLAKAISFDPSLEVVAKAEDPFDARDKILQYHPNVMLCDVLMPKMNGVEFIRRLLPQYPLPVVVVSAVSDMVFDAMNAGAVDFITKPNVESAGDIEKFFEELISKLKTAASAKVSKTDVMTLSNVSETTNYDLNKIIAIGASTGGTEAISRILKNLPSNMPGIVVTQHIPPVFSKMFADRLNQQTNFYVKEAETGDYLEKGKVIIAPGDKHIEIKKIGGKYKVECFKGNKVNGHCPSVDVLFHSVAKEATKDAVGVILTGMGIDGAKGLLEMRKNGAFTLGQNEASCVVYGMPKAAYNLKAVDKQVALNEIPKYLHTILME